MATTTKEIAVGKRAKISEAQQSTLLAVLIASLFLGVAICLVSYFIKQISFNTEIIMEQEQQIVKYSNVIKNIGVCKKPNGNTYSSKELEECTPDAIEISQIPDSLRAKIINDLASNQALNSVPKESSSNCINPDTNKNYTYSELIKEYNNTTSTEARLIASQRIRSCSALRIIPDALPAFQNEEALLASLNKLFIVSDWEPESISPSGDAPIPSEMSGVNTMTVKLSIEGGTDITTKILSNIERSIREFNIEKASLEWSGDNTLDFNAQATAYFIDEATISEGSKIFKIEKEEENK